MLIKWLKRWAWVWLAAGFAVAISNDSLWIDEALTATKAREATLGAWWHRIAGEKMSDLQMPLYMISIWGYAKVCGTGEWILRMMNLPWLVLGAVAFVRSFSNPNQKIFAGVMVLVSPFAWYYLNEARPYAMQLGGALLALGALQALGANGGAVASGERRWFAAFCLGLGLLGGGNMLGMFWVASALGVFVVLRTGRGAIKLLAQNWILTAATGGVFALLGGYYFWTLTVGARASAVAGTNWANVAFAAYELAGFNGLGPGRLQLREAGIAALRPYIGWLLAFGLAWVLIIVALLPGSISKLRQSRALAIAAGIFGPCLVLIAAGYFAHFRLLGRHLTPLAAVLVWFLALSAELLWRERILWKRVLVGCFVALSLFSCLSLRFAPRHLRDDYRAAAGRAQAALNQGQTVWWSAAQGGAEYYHLPLGLPPGRNGAAAELINVSQNEIATLPNPALVVVSKPDLHDARGAVRNYLSQHGYELFETLPGFTLWIHPGRKPLN